ncbi:CopD family protein [Telmatospirillum sp. J64-1]|uniref:CopD family protein n=1 Tax=Telmatospirillum sp. J64-1 TaxID=2502183 RepID=UPI002107B238|nr:CopD family protein [Telmatospirillum sp. J64-1]
MSLLPWVLALHTLAAVIWVGGMFFAHMLLRPALGDRQPADRLGLWRQVLPRFFRWVWLSIATLLVTGYGVVLWGYGGFGNLPPHVDIMQTTGLMMMALYAYLFFLPWRAFRRSFDKGELAGAAGQLGKIRQIITINLPLGLFTTAVGATGGFWTY